MIQEYDLNGIDITLKDTISKAIIGNDYIRIGAYNGSSWIYLGYATEDTIAYMDKESKMYETSIKLCSGSTEDNLIRYQNDIKATNKLREERLESIRKGDLSEKAKKEKIEQTNETFDKKIAEKTMKFKARQRTIDRSLDQLDKWIPFLDRKVMRITKDDTLGFESMNILFDGCESGLYWTEEEFVENHKRNENKRRSLSTNAFMEKSE